MVLVVLPDIPEHSKANCFVLSELSLTLNPLSSVTKALEVKDDNPAIVVAVPPKDTEVLPIVNEELAKLLLAIDDASVSIVPVSLGNVSVLSLPVAFAAVSIVSFASADEPSNVIFPLAIDIALAASTDPETKVVPIRVVEVNEVNPVKVP